MGSVDDVRQGIEQAKAKAEECQKHLLAAQECAQQAADIVGASLQGSQQQDALEIQQRYQVVAGDAEEMAGQLQQCMDDGDNYVSRL